MPHARAASAMNLVINARAVRLHRVRAGGDRLVSPLRRLVRIDGDLLKRPSRISTRSAVVTRLRERTLLVVDRASIVSVYEAREPSSNSARARSDPVPPRLQRPGRERSRTVEVASKAQGIGASQHPASEILAVSCPTSACTLPHRFRCGSGAPRRDANAAAASILLAAPSSGHSRCARGGVPALPGQQRRLRAGDGAPVAGRAQRSVDRRGQQGM